MELFAAEIDFLDKAVWLDKSIRETIRANSTGDFGLPKSPVAEGFEVYVIDNDPKKPITRSRNGLFVRVNNGVPWLHQWSCDEDGLWSYLPLDSCTWDNWLEQEWELAGDAAASFRGYLSYVARTGDDPFCVLERLKTKRVEKRYWVRFRGDENGNVEVVSWAPDGFGMRACLACMPTELRKHLYVGITTRRVVDMDTYNAARVCFGGTELRNAMDEVHQVDVVYMESPTDDMQIANTKRMAELKLHSLTHRKSY